MDEFLDSCDLQKLTLDEITTYTNLTTKFPN